MINQETIDLNSFRVSVVIPCYNHALWLSEAINSVLAQTHQPVELVVVDDGSTDDTADICRKYPKLRYVWQPNAGPSAARNTGLRETSGEFICFLDADDLLMPKALAHGIEALKANPKWALVYGGHVLVDAQRKPLFDIPTDPEASCYRALLRLNHIANPATVLFRRVALIEVGGFDTALEFCEDYEIYLRISRRHDIGAHAHMVAEYRIHDTNRSHDLQRILKAFLTVLKAQEHFVAGSNEDRWALREGISFGKRYYGKMLIKQALSHLAVPGRRVYGISSLTLACRLALRAFPLLAMDAARKAASILEEQFPMPLRRIIRRATGRKAPMPTSKA